MWYEIIPSMLVVMAGVGLPQWAAQYVLHKVTNNPYCRFLEEPMNIKLFLRDEVLTDNPWAAGDEGLKNIPDD